MPTTTTTTRSVPSGFDASRQMELFPPAPSISEASPISSQPISQGTSRFIGSLALGAGHMPSSSLDGESVPSGLQAFPANHTAPPVNGEAGLTSETCGQFSFGWSESADPPSSLASKSPPPVSSATYRKCKACGEEKLISEYRLHNKGGPRGTCRDCENTKTREEKPWRSERKRAYQAERRKTHRGFVLTNEAKQRSIEKGIPFELDWREIQERIDLGICEVTGLPFDLDNTKGWNTPSLDQIEPSKGYTKQNTRVVLYALNTMANNWGTDLILRIADAIREKQSVSASNVLSRRIYEHLKVSLQNYGSTEYELTWRTQITPSGHVLYRHVPLMRRTSDSDCFGWPTPSQEDRGRFAIRRHKGGNLALDGAAQLAGWPTPNAFDAAADHLPITQNTLHRGHWDQATRSTTGNLAKDVRWKVAPWPTPNTPSGGRSTTVEKMDATGRTADGKKHTASLEHAVKFSGPMPSGSPASTAKRGALNPAFPRWLMGYPPEWDDCAPTETASFLKRRQNSSEP